MQHHAGHAGIAFVLDDVVVEVSTPFPSVLISIRSSAAPFDKADVVFAVIGEPRPDRPLHRLSGLRAGDDERLRPIGQRQNAAIEMNMRVRRCCRVGDGE